MIHEERVINGRDCQVRYHDLDPQISFVVPVFNASSTLEWALGSLFAQNCTTDTRIEIVCVDDASTDGSREIIDGYAKDARVTIVSHEKNAGYGASMNDGIACARGKWIGILEPDDYLLPNMTSVLMARADSCDCDIVKSPYIRELRDEGVPRGEEPREYLQCSYRYRIHPATEVFDITDPGVDHLLRHHPSIWSAIYRKDFLAENNIMFHEYPGAGWADNEFFYDTLLRARISYVDEPFYVYREETSEEALRFKRDNRFLLPERWNSMADIIERVGIAAESVLKSHISKGFTYFKEQQAANGDDEEAMAQALAMFDRMDPKLVFDQPELDPRTQARFAEHRKIDAKGSKLRYGANLVNEFVYRTRSNGFGYAFRCIKDHI